MTMFEELCILYYIHCCIVI